MGCCAHCATNNSQIFGAFANAQLCQVSCTGWADVYVQFRVILCVYYKEDFEIYSTLMPAYFPRNSCEETEQVGLLPPNILDNEWGDLVREER